MSNILVHIQLKTQDDAVQEQKTKGVDVRQQAADGEAVGKGEWEEEWGVLRFKEVVR